MGGQGWRLNIFGCCGTTPAHIKEVYEAVETFAAQTQRASERGGVSAAGIDFCRRDFNKYSTEASPCPLPSNLTLSPLTSARRHSRRKRWRTRGIHRLEVFARLVRGNFGSARRCPQPGKTARKSSTSTWTGVLDSNGDGYVPRPQQPPSRTLPAYLS
jgi:hypothetical protein